MTQPPLTTPAQGPPPRYVLRLYVSGSTIRSLRAIDNVGRICRERLADNYDLEVIDAYQSPERLVADQVVALPTLVRQLPTPLRRLVGDLSDLERVLTSLSLAVPSQNGSVH